MTTATAATAATITVQQQQQQQYLVRLNHAKTHVLTFGSSTTVTKQQLLHQLSVKSRIPRRYLRLLNWNCVCDNTNTMLSAATISCIRGGKGGFGTLLKGQSKQASAKCTMDFGACRDLNGRRLRHVNDEIKLQKWRQFQNRNTELTEDETRKLFQTSSGITNWYLMIPKWSEISSSQRKKGERQRVMDLRQQHSLYQQQLQWKQQKQSEQDQAVQSYANAGKTTNDTTHMESAIHEGMKKRKRPEPESTTTTTTDTSIEQGSRTMWDHLCAVSGDTDISIQKDTRIISMESKSEFATVVLVLPPGKGYYFETTLPTNGICQVGWANLTKFTPNSDTGDGVGDDLYSYGYDGSRGLKFHNGTDTPYGSSTWKKGSVLGCYCDASTIHYFCNGIELGIAFTLNDADTTSTNNLVPAWSMNQGERLEINIGPNFSHAPPNYNVMGISDILQMTATTTNDTSSITKRQYDSISNRTSIPPPTRVSSTMTTLQSTKAATTTQKKQTNDSSTPAAAVVVINVNDYQSVQELVQNVSLESLKYTLQSLGCKCGGTIEERAKRLFSIKGLTPNEYPLKVRGRNFTTVHR